MVRTRQQVTKASGFLRGALLADADWAFWTMTAWDCQESMRQYMLNGSHKKAMPRLIEWCDQASVAHWAQASQNLPSWIEAAERMRATGRPSKVRHPDVHHADLSFKAPRTAGAASIYPA
jgi:hypothetical protein